jgi:hypothetical protein
MASRKKKNRLKKKSKTNQAEGQPGSQMFSSNQGMD